MLTGKFPGQVSLDSVRALQRGQTVEKKEWVDLAPAIAGRGKHPGMVRRNECAKPEQGVMKLPTRRK